MNPLPGTPVVVSLDHQTGNIIGTRKVQGNIIGHHSNDLYAVLFQADKSVLLVHKSRLELAHNNLQESMPLDPRLPL